MGGIGSGVNSGGFREGAGRPKGARNKKALALIDQAEADDALMPITFLLDTMRNVSLPLNTRLHAAALVMPYLHVRLTALRVTGDPDELTDMQLLGRVAKLEEIAAAMPEPPPPDNDQPGAVLRRPGSDVGVSGDWKRTPAPAPAEAQRLRYDPIGKRMVSVVS